MVSPRGGPVHGCDAAGSGTGRINPPGRCEWCVSHTTNVTACASTWSRWSSSTPIWPAATRSPGCSSSPSTYVDDRRRCGPSRSPVRCSWAATFGSRTPPCWPARERWCFHVCRICRSIRTARSCTPRASCTGAWRTATRPPPTLRSSPGRSPQLRPGRLEADLAAALHDHSVTEALEQVLAAVDPTAVVGDHGRARAAKGVGPVPGQRPAGPWPGRGRVHRALRRRSGGDGGGQPGRSIHRHAGPVGGCDRRPCRGRQLGDGHHRVGPIGARGGPGSIRASGSRWASRPGSTATSRPTCSRTRIAKFFTNALREDILLRLCRGGLVYLPGAAGTVQEVFQAVTPNFYAPAGQAVVPLVMVGAPTTGLKDLTGVAPAAWARHRKGDGGRRPLWPI